MQSVFRRLLTVELDIAKTERVTHQDYLPFRLARHFVVEDRDSVDLATLLELLFDLLLVSGVMDILDEDAALVAVVLWRGDHGAGPAIGRCLLQFFFGWLLFVLLLEV